ncbi:MAG: KPN_02809 family neutral zinc metallopeptidase [Candidatus Angelobacter sp.]
MRWTPGGTSGDIEDRRDEGGGGGGFGFGGMHIGIGGMIILLILSFVFKRNFFSLLGGGGGTSSAISEPNHARDAQEEPTVRFVSFVLDDAQQTWAGILQQEGIPYRHAKLVLFRDATSSGCGSARSATGPFYCPTDEKVYIDLGFYDELKRRFGAPGDFAQAYVLAHELGHHVQKLIGVEQKVRALQHGNPGAGNQLSVKLELQADCLAGVWAHSTDQRKLLEKGDAESAMNAAAAVGDDRLQKMSTGRISPESFTHGSSAQRTQWFSRGMDQGTIAACNTFQ